MIFAKPQLYKDFFLRSQLEYDWARAFDSDGLKWTYETEIFRDGRRSYKPDFLIEDYVRVEVKGDGVPMNPSIYLCPRPLIILLGPPRVHTAILVSHRLLRCSSWDAAYRRIEV